LTFAKSFINR
ncbi:his Kinase A domain protein, partial [Vibrio parahaemolyticus V-223/04]